MKDRPAVKRFDDGSTIWEHTFEHFKVKVYVPFSPLKDSLVNYGYEAPYLLYFEENELTCEEAKKTADELGFSEIAASKESSVVFVMTTCKGGWAMETKELFKELIANSKIHQYHKDGYAILINKVFNTDDGYAIRGAIFRTYIYAHGAAADYVAANLCQTIDGQGLWGLADITPTCCILDELSIVPVIGRRDMPIASIGNSFEINTAIEMQTDIFFMSDILDVKVLYKEFLSHFLRWGWVGELSAPADFEGLDMTEEFCEAVVKTTPDNYGDYEGSEEHGIGYIAYYNNDLFKKERVPLMLCFHGGGDSAMHIAQVSRWYRVAHDHDFLLVCVEDHLNSTASETIELLSILKDKYPIDETRVYATGFSMGGCKTWDLYQEYPDIFAGMAPMDATFPVGYNLYNNPSPVEINKDCPVPLFYVGGEETPLPELPFQEIKCFERMAYVFKVNDLATPYSVTFEDKENWPDRIWGISGDEVFRYKDEDRNSILTVNTFKSRDGRTYTAFASVSGQGHECRYHSCENAWLFLKRFSRKDGRIIIDQG
ncbi:MAG: hypothetical protein K6G69_07725 [Lachnospiraceae bacterium]|nr:hypothetical protein [Lachnospiraceae bacterium]